MFGKDWCEILEEEFQKPYYKELMAFVRKEYELYNDVKPPFSDIFNAFRLTSYAETKVVLLGQDPYPTPGVAHGLCFSVTDGTPIPKSLKNIFQELKNDLGCDLPQNGNLTPWAKQGVLLLNTILTLRRNEKDVNAHRNRGWEKFTDKVIRIVNEKKEPVVFLLWGNDARSKKRLITNDRHCVIESKHPSPFSAHSGFFGSRPFSRTNAFLTANGRKPIKWDLTP